MEFFPRQVFQVNSTSARNAGIAGGNVQKGNVHVKNNCKLRKILTENIFRDI